MRHLTDPVLSARGRVVHTGISPDLGKRITCATLLAVSLACSLQQPAFAQQPATISGFVADPSGAGVPSASLTLTNQDTAVVLISVKSDSGGNFAFQAVPAPATYAISIQAAGFTRHEQKDLIVTAGERRSVGTIVLVVGSITDSVTVQAGATPVQTQSRSE